MNARTSRPPDAAIAYVGLGLALLAGALLRFWDLQTKSLFLDEAFSLSMGALPIPDMLRVLVTHDDHPPLFYLATHAAQVILHWPDERYRLLTAPFGLLTIIASWAIMRRWFGDLAGALTALFVATAPALVDADRLFRMYAPLAALTTASWWALGVAVQAQGAKRRWAWAAYAVLAVALPYVQYLGAFVLASQVVFALVRRKDAWPALICIAVAAVAFVPWLHVVRAQYGMGATLGTIPGVHYYRLGIARSVLWGDGLPETWLTSAQTLDYALTIALAAALVWGAWAGRHTIMPYWLLPVLLQVGLSVVTGKNLMVPRYFVYLIPALAAVLAMLVSWLLTTRARVAGVAFAVALLGINAVSVADVLLVPKYQATDWYAVDLLLTQNERPTDAIIFDQSFPFVILRRYGSVNRHDVCGVLTSGGIAACNTWTDARANRRIWYIENQADNVDPEHRVLEHLHRTRPVVRVWTQRHVAPDNSTYVWLFGTRTPTKR